MGIIKASGVPISTLAAFMSKRTELIKLDTLLHICEGFGITIFILSFCNISVI